MRASSEGFVPYYGQIPIIICCLKRSMFQEKLGTQ